MSQKVQRQKGGKIEVIFIIMTYMVPGTEQGLDFKGTSTSCNPIAIFNTFAWLGARKMEGRVHP